FLPAWNIHSICCLHCCWCLACLTSTRGKSRVGGYGLQLSSRRLSGTRRWPCHWPLAYIWQRVGLHVRHLSQSYSSVWDLLALVSICIAWVIAGCRVLFSQSRLRSPPRRRECRGQHRSWHCSLIFCSILMK